MKLSSKTRMNALTVLVLLILFWVFVSILYGFNLKQIEHSNLTNHLSTASNSSDDKLEQATQRLIHETWKAHNNSSEVSFETLMALLEVAIKQSELKKLKNKPAFNLNSNRKSFSHSSWKTILKTTLKSHNVNVIIPKTIKGKYQCSQRWCKYQFTTPILIEKDVTFIFDINVFRLKILSVQASENRLLIDTDKNKYDIKIDF